LPAGGATVVPAKAVRFSRDAPFVEIAIGIDN
jgi:hypothetical protein